MSNSTRNLLSLAALCGVMAGAAGAVTGTSVGAGAGTDTTADRLTRLETETLLLKARERQLDVRASIQIKENEIAARRTAVTQQNQAPKQDDPVVLGVEGIGGAMYATLELDDGGLAEVQAGDVLSNGMRVLSVAPGNVIVLTAKKKRMRLALQTPPRLSPSLPLSALPMPMPMPMPLAMPAASQAAAQALSQAASQNAPAAARGGAR